MRVKSIQQIVESGLCTGCGLCASVLGQSKVEMRLSPEGYLRPYVVGVVNREDISRVEMVCPGIHIEHSQTEATYHPAWGPIEKARTGYSTDSQLHREGSSGGVLSALVLHLLDTAQVDFVAQIAVSKSEPLINELQLSRTRGDVLRAAGSRYAPSAPLVRFEELLAKGRRFALLGKPCDMAAVRRLALYDKRVGKQVLYLLSFMCAGIPSMQGTQEVLSRMGIKPDHVKSFRYRGDGWPGKARAVSHDGKVAEMDYTTSWGTILNRHLQFRCKICPDGTGEFADIVCADAWYGKDGYPDFDEHEGRSIILSRTPAGEALVQEAIRADKIRIEGLPVTEIAHMQPYQLNRKRMVLARALGTRLRLGYAPKFKRLSLIRNAISASPLDWLRNVWGTFKRADGERK